MPKPIHYNQRMKAEPVKEEASPPPAPEERAIQHRNETIKELVLKNIGKPDDLIFIDIKMLWDKDHFRVNVYREIKNNAKLTDSYFLHIVTDGFIASPPLDRKYNEWELKRSTICDRTKATR